MCTCHYNEAGEIVVCDACASEQIEALSAPTPGQVELVPGTLTPQECEELTSSVADFFAQPQLGGRS